MQLVAIGVGRAPASLGDWTQFIFPNGPFSSPPADPGNSRARRPIAAELSHDRSAAWLRNAALGLCVLAAASAAVSFTAQYRMVYADRRLAVVAGLEAAIPDAAAPVSACLGIALALHGRRAFRARALNVASVGASVFMNVIAAAPGWRSLAVWVMPPVAYALASDTLIGVIRSWVIARHKHLNVSLAADEVTPLAVAGGLVLWLLRLSLAPASTLAGFRAWVLEECPIAPGRRADRPETVVAAAAAPRAISPPRRGTGPRGDTKSARFLSLVTLPGPGEGFDIAEFLSDTGTLYLIAEAVSAEAPVALLFAAMASEIHYAAAQIGQASPGGRLDPPLLMGLDEVTQICPVPLPFWLADSGGKGIQVAAVAHGEAQLVERWGEHGRQVILDTCSVKCSCPASPTPTTLDAASKLCGQASWRVRGQDHSTRHDVSTPDMIRQLPAGHALVIRGGYAPVIARLPRAWKNPAYRRVRHEQVLLPPAVPMIADLPPEPDIPDHVPPAWIPGNGTSFPWS